MLAASHGIFRDEASLGALCGTTALGCTVQDLIRSAQSLGLHAELLKTAGEQSARDALSQQAPFIAMIDVAVLCGGPMSFQWHFVVVLALAQDEVNFHDPADGPDRRSNVESFLAAWSTAAYRGVRIWTP